MKRSQGFYGLPPDFDDESGDENDDALSPNLPPDYDSQGSLGKSTKQLPPQARLVLANLIGSRSVTDWRRQLAEAVATGKIVPNCNLPGWLQNIRVLGKTSVSATSVILGNTSSNEGVSLKMAYAEKPGAVDNSLAVERALYEIYFDYILRHYLSPNVVTFITSFSCSKDEFVDALDANTLSDLIAKNQMLNVNLRQRMQRQGNYNVGAINFLVTEKTQGKTLQDLINKPVPLTLDEWRNVLFQILYTLEVFNRLGLRHNDAHLNNIFVDEFVTQQSADYLVADGVFFNVSLKYFVKFFDLDLSASHCDKKAIHPLYHSLIDRMEAADVCINKKLEHDANNDRTREFSNPHNVSPRMSYQYCPDYGLCNDKNLKYDAFETLGWIWNVRDQLPDEVTDFIESVIDATLLERKWAFAFHPGSWVDQNCSYHLAQGNRSHTFFDDEVIPVKDMLLSPFFDPLRVARDKVEQHCLDTAASDVLGGGAQITPIYMLPLLVGQPDDYWEKIIPEVCFETS